MLFVMKKRKKRIIVIKYISYINICPGFIDQTEFIIIIFVFVINFIKALNGQRNDLNKDRKWFHSREFPGDLFLLIFFKNFL